MMICIDDEGSTKADEPRLVLMIRFNQPYLKPARAFFFKDVEVPNHHLFIRIFRYEIDIFYYFIRNRQRTKK